MANHPARFQSVDQVKAYIATLPPSECRITPHHSASYIWLVHHPRSFGRLGYGFSSDRSLLDWANEALLPLGV